jgi:hypothetical protein
LADRRETGGMKTRAEGAKKGKKGLGGWPLPVVLLAVTMVSSSGCIWLAIPSLAYEGYKYEKTGSFTGSSSPSSSSPSSSKSQDSNSNNNNSSGGGSSEDHSIE